MIINKKRFSQMIINKKCFKKIHTNEYRQKRFLQKEEILTDDHKRFSQIRISTYK